MTKIEAERQALEDMYQRERRVIQTNIAGEKFFDIALVVCDAYSKCLGRDGFVRELKNDGRLHGHDLNMLYKLCNSMWHSGYIAGVEEFDE